MLCFGLLTACGGDGSTPKKHKSAGNDLALDVDTTLADTSYTLLTQDSSTVTFPQDFTGKPIVLGTIYTNCPNVCPKITANMKNVRDKLASPNAVHFVSITFDPVRDTPSQLAAYRTKFGLDDTSWHVLTGNVPTIRRLMDRLGVRHTLKGTDREFPAADTATNYIFTHSNQITLIDSQGRVRAEYGGSQTPPSLLLKDLHSIQP